MKKFMIILVVVVLVMSIAAPALAAGHEGPGTPGHPNIDPDKAGRANDNALDGLHRAHHNAMHNSRADHVLHHWVIGHERCPCPPH